VQQIVGPENCLVVGAIAVSAHGYVRATDDVDLLARISLRDVRRRLDQHGIATRLHVGDILEGGFSCVKGELDGIAFDVLPPLAVIEWDHALDIPMTKKASLKVVDLGGLLALKLRAGGPQDLLDAAMLILSHPEQRERAFKLAEAYRVRERLESVLSAPRVLQSHRELNAHERSPRPERRPRSRRPARRPRPRVGDK
jgi:hypothetical protein